MSELQSFENFIMTCCELDEWDVRPFLKEKLASVGFTFQEDDYKSYRPGRYQEVHNMLAMRGNSPRVCLVAHTDVCRDHGFRSAHKKATPVIKEVNRFGKEMRIIQDKDCQVQVGGDDRLGVAINTWIAIHTGYDLGLLFTTDEEVGAVSADYVSFSELGEFDLLAQVDRGNHSNQLVTSISGVRLCGPDTAKRLIGISEAIGMPRYIVSGLLTDVLSIKGDNKCKEAVNMTCGYHNSVGSSPNEYIDIAEARDTMKFVSSIIQDYDLELIARDEMENREITPEEVAADIAATSAEANSKSDIVWN